MTTTEVFYSTLGDACGLKPLDDIGDDDFVMVPPYDVFPARWMPYRDLKTGDKFAANNPETEERFWLEKS